MLYHYMDFSIFTLDQQIALTINHFSNPFFDWFFPFITDIHKAKWFQLSFIFPILGIWFVRDGKRALKCFFVFAVLIAFNDYIGSLLKHYFMRPRPFVVLSEIIQRSPASGFSFISNHAANSIFIASFFAELFPSKKILFYILSLLIMYSRIYNGVHFPVDVLAGAIVGFLFSQIALKTIKSRIKE